MISRALYKFKPVVLALVLVMGSLVFLPEPASAHQPWIVESGPVIVKDPEVSKGYYDELRGEPRIYRITSEERFQLYLRIAVPQSSNLHGRYFATVYRVTPTREPLITLGPGPEPWEKFFEPFAGDWYFQSPESRWELVAGEYEVEVSGEGNQGKYVLAVGEKEAFPPAEIIRSLGVIPSLKRDFFEQSPATFVLSIFGSFYLASALLFGALANSLVRFIARRVSTSEGRRRKSNLGGLARTIRVVVATAILLWAITTSWSAVLLLISGSMFFEATFAWSMLNAIPARTSARPG